MKNHERKVGTVSRGIRCPIIREGDDLAGIVTDSILEAAAEEDFSLRDHDVISITESVVARCQGNYVTVDEIAQETGKEKRSLCATVSDSLNAQDEIKIIPAEKDAEKEAANQQQNQNKKI